MTRLQRISLVEVLRATAKNKWYRAGDSEEHGSPAGERVTLASLPRWMVSRRAWRGKDGHPSAAYEYQATLEFMAQAKESGLVDILLGPKQPSLEQEKL